MSRRLTVCQGDTTSTGGTVLTGSSSMNVGRRPVARIGDQVACPVCQTTGIIIEGYARWHVDRQPVAGHGHEVACGCPPGSHRLISSQSRVSMGSAAVDPDITRVNRNTLEEEEEEEEIPQEQQITLRIGLFFDGTGNNQGNSERMAGCYATDVGLHDQAEDIRQHCATHGYDGEGSSPDNSYGNDVTNIARLYELYEDQAYKRLSEEAREASLAVYLEGIGTSSGAEDSLYSQGTGRGSTGVLARVEQAPALITRQIRLLQDNNPNVTIRRIEFDLFGFSRGAAAARHCANDLLKGPRSLLAKALPAGSAALAEGFAWRPGEDLLLNFIGLFDTVPGMVAPWRGDFSPNNAKNHGLNLGLAPGAARKVVQLVARDEYRHNFSLTASTGDIVLPGAHSDIGGGYLPRARETLLLSKPLSSQVNAATHPMDTHAYSSTLRQYDQRLEKLQALGLRLELITWEVQQAYQHTREPFPEKRVYAAMRSEREVSGELSLIYLRIMRELGVRHQVPFEPIDDHDPRLTLPAALQPIAAKLQRYALGETTLPGLSEEEEALLQRHYIHLSAHWNAANGWNNSDLEIIFINRPADSGKRTVHPNE